MGNAESFKEIFSYDLSETCGAETKSGVCGTELLQCCGAGAAPSMPSGCANLCVLHPGAELGAEFFDGTSRPEALQLF